MWCSTNAIAGIEKVVKTFVQNLGSCTDRSPYLDECQVAVKPQPYCSCIETEESEICKCKCKIEMGD